MRLVMIKLYSYYRSSAAYRVRIALYLKKIRFETCPVNLLKNQQKSDSYMKLNRQGLVPALQVNDGRLITQSLAIIEWLDQYVEFPKLIPEAPYESAMVRQTVSIIACDIHPLNNLRVLSYLVDHFQIDDRQKSDWYQYWVHQGFKVLESQISANPFCHGGSISMADLYLIPQIYNALRFKIDLSSYPNLMKVYTHCETHPAFISAHPDQQIDSPDHE